MKTKLIIITYHLFMKVASLLYFCCSISAPVPRVQVELSGNSSFSEGVTLTEGEGRVDNYIRIFVPEPHSIAVQFSVSVSSGSAQSGEWVFTLCSLCVHPVLVGFTLC